jgi:hypothetical protein
MGIVERMAMVLAFQRRTDIGDDERLDDDGTREGYWASLTDCTRDLMLLRASSALAIALDPEDEAMISMLAAKIAIAFTRSSVANLGFVEEARAALLALRSACGAMKHET